VCQKSIDEKLREALVLVSAPMDNGHEPVLVEPLESHHRGMKAESIRNLDNLLLRNADTWSGAVIRGIVVRNDGVQAIVAARELEHDKNPLGVFLDARPLQRLRRQRGRRAVQEGWQRRADADAVQTLREEVAARA
jgi:hypothetical protein